MSTFTVGGVPNNECGHSVWPTRARFIEWIQQDPLVCHCGAHMDWWGLVQACYLGVGAAFHPHAPIGGMTLWSRAQLQEGSTTTVKLDALGLPPEATVREINLSPLNVHPSAGILHPAVVDGKSLRRASLPHDFVLHPVPIGGRAPTTQEITIYVQYTIPDGSDSGALLAEATAAHVDGDYRKSVIEAHTAVDLALEIACIEALSSATERKVRNMSFNSKIESLARIEGVRVRSELLTRCNLLNTQRNAIAHPRRSKGSLDQEAAAIYLATAVFGVHFAAWLANDRDCGPLA